jgi:hypothetical protein
MTYELQLSELERCWQIVLAPEGDPTTLPVDLYNDDETNK